MSTKICVVGAGVGGLTVGALLAKQGFHVDIFEGRDKIGGKMFRHTLREEIHYDTGPSLISQPDEIARTFSDLEVTSPLLLPLQECCRAIFTDGTDWSIPIGKERVVDFFSKVSPQLSKEMSCILDISEGIFKFAQNHIFHQNPPSFLSLSTKAFSSKALLKNPKIPLGRYSNVVDSLISNKNLREFFYHYASYVGIHPYIAPGSLVSISHVELNSPIVFPKGGVYSIAMSLGQSVLKYGGRIFLDSKIVRAVPKENSWDVSVENKKLTSTERYDILISNCDPYVASGSYLLSSHINDFFKNRLTKKKLVPSESQFVILFDWQNPSPLSHHVKIFPTSWVQSFSEVTQENRVPQEPCVYLVWPHATDPSVPPNVLFISAMAPNTQKSDPWDESFCQNYSQKILDICRKRLGLSFKGEVFKMISPRDLEKETQAFAGGLYSATVSGFNPTHFHFSGMTPLKNLFFVGAGVHPGAGVTMVMKSARRIAHLVGLHAHVQARHPV